MGSRVGVPLLGVCERPGRERTRGVGKGGQAQERSPGGGSQGGRRWPQTMAADGTGTQRPWRQKPEGGRSELELERARSWDPSLLAPNPSHSGFPCCHGAGKVSGVQFALAGVTRVLSNHPDASRGASSPTSLHASFGNFRVACILGLFRRPHWTVPLGDRH